MEMDSLEEKKEISLNITSKTCPSLIVTTGDQITWTKLDQRVHLIHIVSLEGWLVFDSGELQPNDTASFTFSQGGSFSYVCTSDRGSTGAIMVYP